MASHAMDNLIPPQDNERARFIIVRTIGTGDSPSLPNPSVCWHTKNGNHVYHGQWSTQIGTVSFYAQQKTNRTIRHT